MDDTLAFYSLNDEYVLELIGEENKKKIDSTQKNKLGKYYLKKYTRAVISYIHTLNNPEIDPLKTSPSELYPTEWFEQIQKKEIVKGQYSCEKCEKNDKYSFNTAFFETQIRSADEPSTLIITCYNCGTIRHEEAA